MRRAPPWVTVGLLILGVGAGAGLGISGQTPTQGPLTATGQISRIVAATRQARTARFTYSSTNTSTNRLLRGSTRGSGEVNFARDVMRTAERDRSIGFSGTSAATEKPVVQVDVMDDVWIGRTEYTRIGFDDNPDSPWLKGPTWPKDSFGPLGALQMVGPLGELSLDEGVPGLRVEDAGRGTAHGVETTEYRIVVPTCGASTPSDGLSESTGATSSGSTVMAAWCRPGSRSPRTLRRTPIWEMCSREKVFPSAASPASASSTSVISALPPPSPRPRW